VIWCPRCDQGWVVRCRVRGTEEEIRVCEECDTVWEEQAPSGNPPFLFLEEYLDRFKLEPLWSNLERLEQGATGNHGT
jgi:transcription elongation factor Elf1